MLSAPATTWAKMVSASVPAGSLRQEAGTSPSTSMAQVPACSTHTPAEGPVWAMAQTPSTRTLRPSRVSRSTICRTVTMGASAALRGMT